MIYPHQVTRVRVQEAAYRQHVTTSFEQDLLGPCGKVREATNDVAHNKCCNGSHCCNSFGTPLDLKNEICQFRKNMWDPPVEGMKWGSEKRKQAMIAYLDSCKFHCI
jgi:hypothetical protein